MDIITFGSPCLVKGTLIVTDRGLIPIEEIRTGDGVVCDDGQWHLVKLRMINPPKKLYTLQAQGLLPITATENHPILTRERTWKWDSKNKTNVRIFGDVKWTPISKLTKNHFVGFPLLKAERNIMSITEEEAWLIGRYIADGYVIDSKRKGRQESYNHKVIFCVGSNKVLRFQKHLDKYHACCKPDRTVVKFEVSSERLMSLCLMCGRGAGNKEIHPIFLNLPRNLLKILIKGYMSGDGCYIEDSKEWRATTISKKLAISLQMAVHKAFQTPCRVYFHKVKPTTVIEGRTVNQHDTYIIVYKRYSKPHYRAYFDNDIMWMPVKSVDEAGYDVDEVYNIEVEDRHNYLANGAILKNCQDLSVAGKRKGIVEGERSNLFFESIRIIREMRRATDGKYPRVIVWENVPGAFSSNSGQDFRAVLEEIAETEIPLPEGGKWANSGMVECDDRTICYRLLDAQYWGVAQRRKRIFLVADFGEQCTHKILFKSESLRRDFTQGRIERQGVASSVEGCPNRAD